MDFLRYQEVFDTYIGAKKLPNEHEKLLVARARKYIYRLRFIPGIRLVAIVNSLAFSATHADSDIDLFIITAKNRIFIVRLCVTLIFLLSGVWRKGEDIAGNFCLSFFVDETAMDMSEIAIEDDIYLFFWMRSMKVLSARGDIWTRFMRANPGYVFSDSSYEYLFPERVDVSECSSGFIDIFLTWCNTFLGFIMLKRARSTAEKKGNPIGIILRPNILKFHDRDRRAEIRDAILESSD